jgi:hypothetical protein
MANYDLIAANVTHESLEFDPRVVSKLTVKQMHLLMTKIAIIRDASRSAEKREIMLKAADVLQGLILEFQSGDLNTAIRNSDRSTLLCADVELARDSVGLVVAESSDPSKAFWLVGRGVQGVDLSRVLKE